MLNSMNNSEICGSNYEVGFSMMGSALRGARRSRGLTQIELADLIDTSQYTISRLELGYDEPSSKLKHRLIDVLTNRNGKLDPLIQKMVKRDPSLSVLDMKGRFLHPAAVMTRSFRVKKADLLLTRYADKFESKWFNHIYAKDGKASLKEKILIEFTHDVSGIGELQNRNPHHARTSQMILYGEHHESIILSRAKLTTATGAPPKLVNLLEISNFVD